MLDMIESDARVLAASVSGKVDAGDVRAYYTALKAKLESHDSIGVMLDLTGFEDATGDAIDTDIQQELSLIGGIIPGMEMRSFDPDSRGDALTWAADI